MRGLSPASSKPRAQVVEEQRVEHLQDVRHAGVVHAERAALLVLGDRLDHRAEDVRVDLRPVEIADVQQVGARDPAEARHVHAARETARRSHRENASAQRGTLALARLRGFVFIARNISPITSCVFDESRSLILSTVLVNSPLAVEDVRVLGEEAEDQPRHEVVHVVAAFGRAPFRIVLQQLDIQLVQPAGGPDVERAFADLLDRRDAGQRQEEAEVVREVPIGAGDRLARLQILGLEILSVRGENKSSLRLGRRRAGLQCGEGLRGPRRAARPRCGCCSSEGRRRGRTCSMRPTASRLIVVSLLPNACRKANGNSSASNAWPQAPILRLLFQLHS